MKHLVIGITGGIGAGKTAATDYFASKGVRIVDADVIAREVVDETTDEGRHVLTQIAEHFGADILNDAGGLQRAKLRAIIFRSPAEKAWLEALMHPLIQKVLYARVIEPLAANECYVMLVSPLLFETEQKAMVDRVLLIDVPEEIQLERASARDGVDVNQIRRIIASQLPRAERQKRADDVVENEDDLSVFYQQLDELHDCYCELT